MSSRIPFIVTYKNPGTLPPVYIAGSFSDPEWQPQEMKHDADQDGEITFRSEVNLEPDKDYQFKLRIGDGDWWALSKDYPIGKLKHPTEVSNFEQTSDDFRFQLPMMPETRTIR